jgi:hypothetical protein
MSFYVTWVESDKAERVEDMLDERGIQIEMLPTPAVIRDREVFVCKDCFQLLLDEVAVRALGDLDFPLDTRCFNEEGELLWEKKTKKDIVYTSEEGRSFSEADIRNLVVTQSILERLSYGDRLLEESRLKAIDAVTQYTLNVLEWQHPATIMDEIFKDHAEIDVVKNLIEEAICN